MVQKTSRRQWLWSQIELNLSPGFSKSTIRTYPRTNGTINQYHPDGEFVCTSSSLDLLIDKQLSTQTKETWEGHRITILCAVRLPTGQTGVKFSWMHIPSNRTVSKQFHEELRGKSYLTITTLKDEDFESLQCRAETASTVKFHVIDIIKLSEYIDWFYWKPRWPSRSGVFLADKTKALQFLFPLEYTNDGAFAAMIN